MKINNLPGFICSSCREGSMEKCEMLASASDVIIIAKICEDGTSYRKTLLLLM